MTRQTNQLLHIPFIAIVAIELLDPFMDKIDLGIYVKPLIMIWIAIYFILNREKHSFTVPVLLAFFFSWLGDVFLMLPARTDMLFFAGVGGFFCAQVMYIIVYSRYSGKKTKGYLQKNPVYSIFFLAYIAVMLILLLPEMEGLMKPIIILYALSLMLMSMTAFNRKGRVSERSYILVFVGSLLFLLSDSLLAINKFHTALALSDLWIMSTYMAAQYLIMRGLTMEK